MKRKILSIFISALFLINLFMPAGAFAAPDQPKDLGYSTSCVGTNSMVSFTWDYKATWDDENGHDYRVQLEGKNELRNVPHPYEIQVDQNDTNKKWVVRRCDGGGPGGIDPCSEAESTYTARKCSISEPDDPVLGPGECGIKVSTVEGSDEDNPELINIKINIKDSVPNLNTGDTYLVKVKGSGATGNGFVGHTQGDRFEFKVNQAVNLNGTQVTLINSNGDIDVRSLNWLNVMGGEPTSSWDNKKYTVEVERATILGEADNTCTGSFQIGSDPGKCIEDSDCFSNKCNSDGKCALGVTKLACAIVNVKQSASGNTTDADYICNTAIGPISADAEGFIKSLLRIILGLAGGILLLLIIINGYKLMTSQGDPEKIKDAREGIIAAILGILLIIFSLSILQLIVIDVIGIPGFSR